MPAVSPWIIVQRKVGAGLDGGVVILPELDKWAGIGIFQPSLAKGIESSYGGLLRVGDDAVNGFLPINVRLVLEVAAEGIAGRRQQKADYRDGNRSTRKPCRLDSAFSPPSNPSRCQAKPKRFAIQPANAAHPQ